MQQNAGKGDVLKQAKVLSDSELKRVLAVISQRPHAARNRMALLLSHYAGLRVGEIATLAWADVLTSSGEIKQQFYLRAENTKANEARAVHVNARLARELLAYRNYAQPNLASSSPLIVSQKGGAFSANSLCQLFARMYVEAGIEGASSHSGRRWFITRLAHAGISAKVIMTLAGHKNLNTTQRYIEVNDELLARAVDRL